MTTGVETDLDLSIDPALRSVDQLDAALGRTLDSFSASLAQALDQLSQPQTVAVDTGSVTTDIDAAIAATDSVVPVSADPTQAVADLDAIAAPEPIDLQVTADTSQAQQALDDLTATAADTVSGIAEVGSISQEGATSIGGLASAASTGTDVLEGLGTNVKGLAAGVGVFVGLSAASDAFFSSATKSESVANRFNATLGESASEVQNVNVGNLNIDLGKLNRELGSSTTQTKAAAAGFAQLGVSSGRSQAEVALSTEQLIALSARAVALNPALGSVGDVAERMGLSLAKGDRATSAFGISLSKSEIAARAMKDTGKATAQELTVYDKAAAGAALATEKYGATLNEDIVRGTKDPIIQLRAIGAEFSGFTSQLAKPLVAPTFQVIRDAQPALKGLASITAQLIGAALPGFTSMFRGVGNLVTVLDKNLRPVIVSVSDGLQIAGKVFEGISVAIKIFSEETDNGAVNAIKALGSVIGAVLFPLAGLHDSLVQLGIVDELPAAMKTASGETITLANSSDILKTALTGTAEEWANLQKTGTGFAQADFAADLNRIGVPLATLRKDLIAGDRGFKDFAAAGIKAKKIEFTNVATGAKLTADEVSKMHGNLDKYLSSEQIAITQGKQLTEAYAAEGRAIQAGSEASFKAKAEQLGLNAAQLASIGASAGAEFGSRNYVAQLAILNREVAAGTIIQQKATENRTTEPATWVALANAIAQGTVTQQNADAVGQRLGFTQDQIKTAISATTAAVDQFVSTATAKLPTASTVFGDLASKVGVTGGPDVGTLTGALRSAGEASLNFNDKINIIGNDFPRVAALLQTQGAAAASATAESFLRATDAQKQQLNDTLIFVDNTNRAIAESTRKFASENVVAATELGRDMTTGYGEGLNLSGATKEQIDQASTVIGDAVNPAKDGAHTAGVGVGESFGAGIPSGMNSQIPGIRAEAARMVREAEDAARVEAESRSPSLLFAELGSDLGGGVALGLKQSQAAVVAEAEAIIKAAAGVAVPSVGPAPVAVPALGGATAGTGGAPFGSGVGGSGGVTIQRIDVTVSVAGEMSPAKAQAVGALVVDGIEAQIAQREAEVTARTA